MKDHELQALLDQTAKTCGVVGAQLAIFSGNEVREFATGLRDGELKLPVTQDTVFQIGSTTKVFNAALVMSLVEAGKLDLNVPVREFIPGFQLADPDAENSVTLRHLLSMSGGIDNGTYRDYGRGDEALGRYVEGMCGIPHIFAPGTAFGYSNASTNVAGYAAARVMGRPWEHLLMERVWEPLRIKHAGLFAEDLLQRPVAVGYIRPEATKPLARQTHWPMLRSIGPAGGMTYCSAGELIRLARLFLEGGRADDGTQVLTSASVEYMQQPQISLPGHLYADHWCLGPSRVQWGQHEILGHSGTFYCGSSMLRWCRAKNIAAATVVNVPDQGYPLANAVFDDLFPRLFGIAKPAAPTPQTVKRAVVDIQAYLGHFEAFGMVQHVIAEAGILKLKSLRSITHGPGPIECELIPLGEGRFLPTDLRISGNRAWDIAFWGQDERGRATHMLQGVFPLRRTG